MANGNSGKFVTIGCRLPHGLHLDVGKDETFKRVTLNGANSTRIEGMIGIPDGACGITENVPKEHWDEWLRLNAKAPFVVKGHVFAQASSADARAYAREFKDERTGLEPLAKDNDPRLKGMEKVKPLDDKEPIAA